MMDNRDIAREIERVVAGLFGLALLADVCIRLWHLYSGIWYKSVWSAIAGQPLIRGRVCWNYGLWEVCPEGQLPTTLLAAGGVFVSGYLVNAYFMFKLMAAY